jgi:hypothetical protein
MIARSLQNLNQGNKYHHNAKGDYILFFFSGGSVWGLRKCEELWEGCAICWWDGNYALNIHPSRSSQCICEGTCATRKAVLVWSVREVEQLKRVGRWMAELVNMPRQLKVLLL